MTNYTLREALLRVPADAELSDGEHTFTAGELLAEVP